MEGRGLAPPTLGPFTQAESARSSCSPSDAPGTRTPSSAAVPMVNAHTSRLASARMRSAESTEPAQMTGSGVAATTASTSASTSPS